MKCLLTGAVTRISGAQKRAGGVAGAKYSLSICNVTKHYDVNELSENFSGEKITFRSDFLNRLN